MQKNPQRKPFLVQESRLELPSAAADMNPLSMGDWFNKNLLRHLSSPFLIYESFCINAKRLHDGAFFVPESRLELPTFGL